MILIEEDFLNKEACQYLTKLSITKEEEAVPFRDINILLLQEYDLPFTKKIVSYTTNFLGKRGVTAFPERIEITIWKENSKQNMHFDEVRESTNLTSITYLNEGYLGGETAFDNGVIIKPKIGKTVFFDGKKYLHRVNPVTKGKRFVLAIWYTYDLDSII